MNRARLFKSKKSQHSNPDCLVQNINFLFILLNIYSLVLSVSKFKTNYLELESWKKWYLNLVLDMPAAYSGSIFRKNKEAKKMDLEYDDDIAVEVLTYRKSLSNFAGISLKKSTFYHGFVKNYLKNKHFYFK